MSNQMKTVAWSEVGSHSKMEQSMKASGSTTFATGQALKSGQMAQNTKDIGVKTKPMDKVN